MPATPPNPWLRPIPGGLASEYVRHSGSTGPPKPLSANAGTVSYGIGGDACTESVNGVWRFCDYQSGAWTAFKSGLGIRYTRLTVPWDSAYTWSPSKGCVYNMNSSGYWNETFGAGNSWLAYLIFFALAARSEGLTPVVGLGSGNGVGQAGGSQEPYWPNANSSYGINGVGDYQYECGFYGLSTILKQYGVPISHWESYNEPDSTQQTGNNIPSNVAANYLVDAYATDHIILGLGDVLVAGGFNYGSVGSGCCTYIDGYMDALFADLDADGYYPPDAFSGHPYDDPTASGASRTGNVTTDTKKLLNEVNNWFAGSPIWLTEAGVWLNDPTGDGYGSTLGADVDGSPVSQAYGAQGFKNLASVSSQIQAVFWYEFETYGDGQHQGSDTFDSALLGITSPSFDYSGLYNPPWASTACRAPACACSPTATVRIRMLPTPQRTTRAATLRHRRMCPGRTGKTPTADD